MNARNVCFSVLAALLLMAPKSSLWSQPENEATADARSIVKGALDYWRDTSSFAEIAMTIHRPNWEREALMKSWTRGEKDALVRFVKPAKDAGSATLKLGDNMWIYTPKLDRVIKLPFSMMAQSWMGSDFSYNDLAKSDDLLIHFDNRIIDVTEQDGHKVYVIEATPVPDAPVIWGKERVKIRDDHLLLEETFFDQDFKAVKTLKAMEIGPMGGKIYVTRMRMEKLEEAGHWTEISYHRAEFGLGLPNALFTQAELRNPRRQWEQR